MSELIVLDTHIWIWFINQDFDKFPNHWRDKIETSKRVGISCVSCYEVALLAQKKEKLQLPCATDEWVQAALTPVEIEVLPMTPEIALRAVGLSNIHRDPFDRIIIATTIEHQAYLASVDTKFPNYTELGNYLLKQTLPVNFGQFQQKVYDV